MWCRRIVSVNGWKERFRLYHCRVEPITVAFVDDFAEGSVMQKSLLITPELCTSCLQCEMACSFEHGGVFNPAKSRIKVFEFEHGRRAIPYTCTLCAEAW